MRPVQTELFTFLSSTKVGIWTNVAWQSWLFSSGPSEEGAARGEGLEVRLSSCLFGGRRWDTLYQRQSLCSDQQPSRWLHLRALTSAQSKRVLQIKTSRWSYLGLSVWESPAPSTSSLSSSSAPHLLDSKGHEKGREIDSKSWWQESPSAVVHCQIIVNKSHVFIVIIALQQ